MLATTCDIVELVIPPNLAAPSAAGFIEMVGLRNAVEAQALGSDALSCTPAELLPVYSAQEFEPRRMFVARMNGRMVGRAMIEWSIATGTSSTWIFAEVSGEFRRRGIGSALFDCVETLALESGRPIVQSEVLHTARTGGERLPSPTGFGDLSMADDGVVFLRRRGYRLEQIERISFLHLPVNEALLENAFRAARDAAGDQYEVVAWTGRTPQDRIEDLLVLRARMSVDAPSAGLEVDEEPWTPARLAKHDDALAIGEQNRLTVAAQYRPTGRLVGFSELMVPNDRARSVQQQDTLVLSEHRGHRLGMLLKAANLQRLAQLRPRPPLVSTFNAEENRHMLAVNEAIGFRAVGCAGCWRKDA